MLLLALLASLAPAVACGPFIESTVFSYQRHPEPPLAAFVAGPPGVIHPRWLDSFQVAAWRAMIGRPLSVTEQAAFREAWAVELTNGVPASPGLDAWTEARAKLPDPPPVNPSREDPDTWSAWTNCGDDAFRVAAATLRRLSVSDPEDERADWLAAQDRVFAACSDAAAPAPKEAPPRASRWLKEERDWQVAAWYFYQGRWDEADQAFTPLARIGPRSEEAELVRARIQVRRYSLSDFKDAESGARARKMLQDILDNKRLSSVHASATRLLDYVSFHAAPVVQRDALASQLSAGPATVHKLRDFTLLMDRTLDTDGTNGMVEWIRFFHRGLGAPDYAQRRWEKGHELPWLVAALSRADPRGPTWPRLAADADAVPLQDPARPTLDLSLLQGEVSRGEEAAARARGDRLLRDTRAYSDRNMIAALRLIVAASAEEWLALAVAQPVAWGFDEGQYDWFGDVALGQGPTSGQVVPRGLLRGAALTWGLDLPQDLLLDLAPRLDPAPRPRALLSVWTRAAVLGHDSTYAALGPRLAVEVPEASAMVEEVRAARSAKERRFAAALGLLRLPGSRYIPDAGVGRMTPIDQIDDYRDNWWCAVTGAPPPPSFLTDTERRRAAEEQATLIAAGSGPVALGQIVLDWVGAHKSDPRSAEALARIVRATRYSCGGNAAISQRAFKLLQKDYKDTAWAKDTPYWYD